MDRLGCGGLCDGYDLVGRWRHDALPGVCKRRLEPPYTTTLRIDSPACIRSKPLLMSSSFKVCVIRSSILIFFSMYQATIFGTSVRPLAPPKAVPFHTRPVTS